MPSFTNFKFFQNSPFRNASQVGGVGQDDVFVVGSSEGRLDLRLDGLHRVGRVRPLADLQQVVQILAEQSVLTHDLKKFDYKMLLFKNLFSP